MKRNKRRPRLYYDRIYRRRYQAKIKSLFCWCSRPAVAFSRGSPACAHCLRIESWMDRRLKELQKFTDSEVK